MNTSIKLICAVLCLLAVSWGTSHVLNQNKIAKQALADKTLLEDQYTQLETRFSALEEELAQKSLDTALVLNPYSPSALIENLYQLDPDNERKKLRQALFCFQALAQSKEDPLPSIREYFTSAHNVILSGGGKVRSTTDSIKAGTLVPPSTRLGLVDVLRDLNTSESISLLGQILPTALSASEATYMARILLDIDSNLFHDVSLTTARNMLSDTTLGRDDKRQLFDLLFELGDTEMAQYMAGMLYADGKLDTDILNFIKKSLGADAMPLIYEAYSNPDLKMRERAELMGVAMNYVGSNEQATEIFNKSIHSEEIGTPIRAMLILGLSGADDMSSGSAMSPEMAQTRLSMLDSLEQEYGQDRGMSTSLRTTREQLEYSLNPSAYEERPQVDQGAIARDILGTLFSGNAGGKDRMGGLSGFFEGTGLFR